MHWNLEAVDSTQHFLKTRLEAGDALSHLDYVFSEQQTNGVGRHDRSWVSGPGNLYLSIYLKDFSLPVTWVPHWIAVSLIEVLKGLGVNESQAQIKWPNDLLINRSEKLAGVLCEKIKDGVVAGIGMNLVTAPEVDRLTARLIDLLPPGQTEPLNQKVKESILKALSKEPSLDHLKQQYQKYSLLTPGVSFSWEDLHTKDVGEGIFVRYGNHGELIAKSGGEERALFSEEIKIKLN